jgi:hypothetical protein
MTTILVTGSREYEGDLISYCDALEQMKTHLQLSDEITLIHGGAKGTDTIAATEGHRRGWKVVEYQAQWAAYGKKAGPIRNSTLVAQRPQLALAVLLPDSIGTRDCLKKLAYSASKTESRLEYLLLLDMETGQSRWLSPSQLQEEFG